MQRSTEADLANAEAPASSLSRRGSAVFGVSRAEEVGSLIMVSSYIVHLRSMSTAREVNTASMECGA